MYDFSDRSLTEIQRRANDRRYDGSVSREEVLSLFNISLKAVLYFLIIPLLLIGFLSFIKGEK